MPLLLSDVIGSAASGSPRAVAVTLGDVLSITKGVIGGIVFETMGPNLSMTAQQVFDSYRSASGAVYAA